jgi:cyclopropane-fatty-acyl-phospholipid synthase
MQESSRVPKLKLEPGVTRLQLGLGRRHAAGAGDYDINTIGLTLNNTQKAAAEARPAKIPTKRNVEVRPQGWEDFEDKVDRAVAIGSFGHFRHEKYDAFFVTAYNAMADDGILLLHTICFSALRDALTGPSGDVRAAGARGL